MPYQDVNKRAALVLHNDRKDGTILMVSLSPRVIVTAQGQVRQFRYRCRRRAPRETGRGYTGRCIQ